MALQGSAAELIKKAMCDLTLWFKKNNFTSKMILQVHDELVFEVVPEELEPLKIGIKKIMEQAFALKVPLVVDLGVGKNWLEAH